ncbi:hypothetical protein HMPREF0027_1586 [Actinobacillus ureae ATCC 25976]|uniref:Uncharacterized protein n=1 Tax=Actinobacillus ureae ATCC 25976 TaxID=887324 RepID=E8KIB9_9PAST|nr:hypothetical protein HMPREF0027_1586 [Actinobacillus ureae ATCC 25976]
MDEYKKQAVNFEIFSANSHACRISVYSVINTLFFITYNDT